MMRDPTEATRPQRLLFGAGSLIASLLLGLLPITIKDFSREPGLTWSNGGEAQVAVYFLIVGGLVVLATYLLFVVPLVLLWPASSQRKHWYAMLGVAMLCPLFLYAFVFRLNSSFTLITDLRRNYPACGWLELFALCSCGCYLLLINWQHRRLQARQTVAP